VAPHRLMAGRSLVATAAGFDVGTRAQGVVFALSAPAKKNRVQTLGTWESEIRRGAKHLNVHGGVPDQPISAVFQKPRIRWPRMFSTSWPSRNARRCWWPSRTRTSCGAVAQTAQSASDHEHHVCSGTARHVWRRSRPKRQYHSAAAMCRRRIFLLTGIFGTLKPRRACLAASERKRSADDCSAEGNPGHRTRRLPRFERSSPGPQPLFDRPKKVRGSECSYNGHQF
jgi:hypothetical protein